MPQSRDVAVRRWRQFMNMFFIEADEGISAHGRCDRCRILLAGIIVDLEVEQDSHEESARSRRWPASWSLPLSIAVMTLGIGTVATVGHMFYS